MSKDKKLFIITETVLLLGAVFFAFCLIGYTTLALSLGAIAVLVGLSRLITVKFRGRARRTLRGTLTACVVLGLTAFVAVEIPIIAAARTDKDPEAPYIIVLGAGVNGTEPSLSLVNRLTVAKEYMEEYPLSIAVVSGCQGVGEDITEAKCMHDWFVQMGISENRIIMEEKARSTYENIAFSLEKIAEDGGDASGKVAIASSEYHIYRAKYIAEELGTNPVGVAGKTSYPVLRLNYFIREAAAVAVMWLK